ISWFSAQLNDRCLSDFADRDRRYPGVSGRRLVDRRALYQAGRFYSVGYVRGRLFLRALSAGFLSDVEWRRSCGALLLHAALYRFGGRRGVEPRPLDAEG